MKTLKDIRDFGDLPNYIPLVSLDYLKDVAREWIKHLTPKKGVGYNITHEGQIQWIKKFFNLGEK